MTWHNPSPWTSRSQDKDILSITLAGAARSFAGKLFDGLHAGTGATYKELHEETHHALIAKRSFTA